MKSLLKTTYRLLWLFGCDPVKTLRTTQSLPSYFRGLFTLRSQLRRSMAPFPFGKLYPCLSDRTAESGTASGHYFHGDLLVARKIFLDNPERHVDIGSRIDGFVAHVATFRTLEVFDVRRLSGCIPNTKFRQIDLMAPVSSDLAEYCDSLSCLHAIEHFGLGRYGEPIRFDGHVVGLDNMYTLLKHGGRFYLSAPIGPQRIEFNAHRVFSMRYLLTQFQGRYAMRSFSFVDDAGSLFENVPLDDDSIDANFHCHFGCGIFEMRKL